MFSLIFISLMCTSQKIEACSLSPRVAAISDGVIAVVSRDGNLKLYDSNLNFLKLISSGGLEFIAVYRLGNVFLLSNMAQSRGQAVVIEKDLSTYEIRDFNPSFISSDGDSQLFSSGYYPDSEFIESKNQISFYQNQKLIQKFKVEQKSVIYIDKPIMPLTKGQMRYNYNWKGFWAFENSNKDLEIINQVDPAVFNERDGSFSLIDLPNFLHNENMIVKTNEIYTRSELMHFNWVTLHSTSQILGVYRYTCGFVVCYIDPGIPQPEFTRLAFFDLDWNRYGQVQEIPGQLIGLHQDQGYMLTFPDEAWVSELRKVDLKP